MRIGFIAAAASSIGMLAVHPAGVAAEAGEELEEIVVTGTRVANRSALETAAPVDVVQADQLQNLGVSEINQALSVALPSFNFPRAGLADGTDAVRPATLRGLSPDQTLVLVNGKRRHSAALVNVNGTIGRGASAPDLNTLPTSIVQSVEVLRDGASAQYGSDAIAGVINMRLRENREGGGTDLTYGWRETKYDLISTAPPAGATWSSPTSRSRSDGESLTASVWKGLPLSDAGFITVAAEFKNQERTERGGWDHRRQYPLLANGAFDPREATFNRFDVWYGDPELTQKTVFANLGYDVSDNLELYGWASWQDRHTVGSGFYRTAIDARNIPAIYPDGFLPLIVADVTDYSAAFGARWNLGSWDMDSSLVYGLNDMEFTIDHTLNRSIGRVGNKTKFDAGGFDYDQLVLNVSGVRPVEVSAFASPLNIAIGLEARREGYSITAGEPDSYRNGGDTLADGTPTASGSQVFPGFRDTDELDESRTAVGAYVDLEANLTQALLASIAVRGERYSDFGENVSGKVSLRYDFNEHFALRSSVQNGFRAPSLQQRFFRATATNNVPGVGLVDVTTFPAHDPVARVLGARDLDAEESRNFSVGAVIRLGELDVTIDAYRIDIDDRIVLSENLTSPAVRNFLNSRGFVNAGGGRFFINGVDTTTEGVDIVMSYPLRTATAGLFDFTLAANFNSTDVTRVPEVRPAGLTPPPILFDRINILTFEEGEPENKFSAAVNWSLSRFGASLRATRYGDLLFPGPRPGAVDPHVPDVPLSAKTLVDLELRFDITANVRTALGADNVTDEYPDANPTAANATGAQSFSNYSPFGRSGRFVYGKVSYRF